MTDDLTPVLLNKLNESVKKQTEATNQLKDTMKTLGANRPGSTTVPPVPDGEMPDILKPTRTDKLPEIGLSKATIDALVAGIANASTLAMMGAHKLGPGKAAAAGQGMSFVASLADQSEALNKTSTEFAKFGQEILASNFKFGDITDGIKASEESLNKLNISSDHVIKTMTVLRSSSRAVQNELKNNGEQGKKNVVQLAAMAAQYEKMGVGPEEFAKAIETARSSLGLFTKSGEVNTKQLEKLMGKSLALSKVYKTPLGSTIKDLTQSFPQLAIMGVGPLVNNFDKLSNVAAETGVEINSLMEMSKKFNTLEGAADVVGNLSAVLKGTTVSVGEMIAAEPAERVQAVLGDIRGAIEEGRFELAEGGMERVYQVQALAQAAGTTEEEMNKLLRNQTDIEGLFEARAGQIKVSTDEAAKGTADMLSAEEKKQAVYTTLNNKVVQNTDSFKEFTKIVNTNTEQMRMKIGEFGESLGTIPGILGGIKTTIESFTGGEGAKEGAGFFGTLLFRRQELFQENTMAIEKLLRQTDDLVIKLGQGVTDLLKAQAQARQDPATVPEDTFKPDPGQSTTPRGQSVKQDPNGDIKITTVFETDIPAGILAKSVEKKQIKELQ